MVRAGVCRHPSEWIGGSYAEILGHRFRYRIVNRERLKSCLGMTGATDALFADWYEGTVREAVLAGPGNRCPFWSEALAVGSEEWIRSLVPRVRHARVEWTDEFEEVGETAGSYALYVPKRDREAFWRERNA
jgi:putative transposase